MKLDITINGGQKTYGRIIIYFLVLCVIILFGMVFSLSKTVGLMYERQEILAGAVEVIADKMLDFNIL